jgi:transposase
VGDAAEGPAAILASVRRPCPRLRHLFADGGHAGPKPRGALAPIGAWTVEVLKRSDTATGFEVLPRRWVAERSFAWQGRCRRPAGDREKSVASAEGWIDISHTRLTTRGLARYCCA